MSGFLPKNSCDSSENLFFLFPKEFKLAEYKAVDQQENLVKRQYQQQVQNRIQKSLTTASFDSKKIKNGIFDKQDGKSGAGKNHQNHYNLK